MACEAAPFVVVVVKVQGMRGWPQRWLDAYGVLACLPRPEKTRLLPPFDKTRAFSCAAHTAGDTRSRDVCLSLVGLDPATTAAHDGGGYEL